MKSPKSKPTRRNGRAVEKTPRRYAFTVIVEKDEDGYFASCPALQGCYTDGETYEEALANIAETIQLHVEARRESGEDVPANDVISVTTVVVSA